MKTLILMLLCFILTTREAFAGDPKCDSLMKVLRNLSTKSNAYANKYKAMIDSRGKETDRLIMGSTGDTTSAKGLIAIYEKDTAYFQKCLDTALSIQRNMKETEFIFTKACDNVISSKIFYQVQDQNAKALIYLEGFIDFCNDMIDDWKKKMKHTKKEYKELIEFYKKEEAKRKGG